MTTIYCKKGRRRCSVSKQCLLKTGTRKTKCLKGSRKCSNSKCYKKNKSILSRRRFTQKLQRLS